MLAHVQTQRERELIYQDFNPRDQEIQKAGEIADKCYSHAKKKSAGSLVLGTHINFCIIVIELKSRQGEKDGWQLTYYSHAYKFKLIP